MKLPTLGARDEVSVDGLRAARVTAARRCQAWTEIDGPLINRGPVWLRWWVDAETDQIFVPYRGQAFATDTASIVADRTALVFVVQGDSLNLYERVKSPATWTEHLERQARRLRVAR